MATVDGESAGANAGAENAKGDDSIERAMTDKIEMQTS